MSQGTLSQQNNTTTNSAPVQGENQPARRFSRPGGPSNFNRRPGQRPGDNRGGGRDNRSNDRRGPKKPRRREEENSDLESQVIQVRRVTRVVKGGKRMRFSALVVVGDKQGRVGFALKKGIDFQDSVAKATKKAQSSLIKIKMNETKSVDFSTLTKHKSCMIMLKPANQGTGLIAGSFLRPVLALAGVENIYSKIVRSRNKVAGVQAVFKALENYQE